jgi:hypothetical protein
VILGRLMYGADDWKEVGGGGQHADRSSLMGDRRWPSKATVKPLARWVSSSELSVSVEHILACIALFKWSVFEARHTDVLDNFFSSSVYFDGLYILT